MTDNVRAINKADTPSSTLHLELGVSAPQRVAASLYDDWLPQLKGAKALKTWREMATNDATVSAILFAIDMLMREVDWTVKPADESTQAQTMADFLSEQIEALAHPLSDTVGEATTALPYGFSFHETVYSFDGGRVGWERFAHRPQETLLRWELDDKLRPTAFVQTMPRGQVVPIPIEKGLLFRTDTTIPSGTPILRGAFRSWMLKKRAEEHLMIGMSRNLQGMPMALIPSEILAAGEGNAKYDAVKKLVTRVKRDEQMGILFPSDRDANGELMYEFTLVSPDGDPNFEQAVSVIRMFANDIATTVLAQFIGLGRDAAGSRALAEPLQNMFQTALGAILDILEDAFNRQPVATLFDLNPSLSGPRPRLVHGEVKNVDLGVFGDFLLKATQSGAVIFTGEEDDPMLNQVLDMAGLDSPNLVQ